MRAQLRVGGVAESVVDDAVLVLSELLSNACRHGRPLGDALAGDGDIRAAWHVDTAGRLTVEVTDGGGPTRPVPSKPSVTARGGRGLNIITALAADWGVRDEARGEVTVWAVLPAGHGEPADRRGPAGPAPAGRGYRGDHPSARPPVPASRPAPSPSGRTVPQGLPLPALSELGFTDAFDELD